MPQMSIHLDTYLGLCQTSMMERLRKNAAAKSR